MGDKDAPASDVYGWEQEKGVREGVLLYKGRKLPAREPKPIPYPGASVQNQQARCLMKLQIVSSNGMHAGPNVFHFLRVCEIERSGKSCAHLLARPPGGQKL